MKKYTVEDFKAMTTEQRETLYENARVRQADGGQAIMDALDASGLQLRSGGISATDPLHVRMEEIIWSQEGQNAAIEAVTAGMPALCGVDPILKQELKERYQPHDQGTMTAGAIIAIMMRHRGYDEDGSGPCPDGCVASTGLKWKPAKK